MPREVVTSSRAKEKEKEETDSDDSPRPRPGFGSHRRAQVLVISDSDSDSDSLPSPSQLRIKSKQPVASSSGPKVKAIVHDEIINISSDSEVELTPTKPRVGARLPLLGKANIPPRPAIPNRLLSASPSRLPEALKRTTLLNSPTRDEEPPIELDGSEEDAAVASPIGESYSSTPNESNDDDGFDEDLPHPGVIAFDPGPRRPRVLPLGSDSSLSTQSTSLSSQSSIWNDDTPSADLVSSPSTSPVQSRNNSQQNDEPAFPKTPRPSHKTGNAKAGSSGSGYRSRVKGTQDDDDDSAAPETPKARPRPKPKPKAQLAIASSSSAPVSLSPKPTPRNRAKVLEAAAIALFLELNESAFDGKLPRDCPIIWSKKLNTTAGRAHWKRHRAPNGDVLRHETSIELSTKVVDCEERIRNTLSHEMCHLAAWIFDSETNKPHGPAFKRWGNRVMEIRQDITISTCHSYEISYKYEWKCSAEECGRTYGRHSKSIDPAKQVCGACRGQLVPLFAATSRRNPFQEYLKIHMKDFKAANPGMQHGEAMKRLGEMFRAEKEATVDAELDQVMAGMTRLALDTFAE
ncbi:hypothetical protein BDV93DRAFT_601306 [Ceratobasidium sp. AG-I]|nr:hypothetical protein BDV93DRAFT_601306 [Ceratobasidium sp. AG-I]